MHCMHECQGRYRGHKYTDLTLLVIAFPFLFVARRDLFPPPPVIACGGRQKSAPSTPMGVSW